VETLFDFGDDLNDLNELEMQVSYEEIEVRVRFSSRNQLATWKTAIQEVLKKEAAAHPQEDQEEDVQQDPQLGDIDLSLEKSSRKPILFQKFDTKSKARLERESMMREHRLTVTRALKQSIERQRSNDSPFTASESQVQSINALKVSASKSSDRASAIIQMNQLIERIKSATTVMVGEVGDIGSESSQNRLIKQLHSDISQFQNAFSESMAALRNREDVVQQILRSQEIAL